MSSITIDEGQGKHEGIAAPGGASWLIAGLCLGAGGIAVGLFLHTTATAAPIESQGLPATRQVFANYLCGPKGDLSRLESMLRSTDALMQQCTAAQDAIQVPLSNLRADPFRIGDNAAGGSDISKVGESDVDRVAMLQQVQKLTLQSIMVSGDLPACTINGHLYREGEVIDDFNIERIETTEVVVRNGGYRFELKIAR